MPKQRAPSKRVTPWTWRRMVRDHAPKKLLITLFVLGTYWSRDGYAFPGQATIAKGARASVRTVRRHIDQAESEGWLRVELDHRTGKGWRRNVYLCVVPEDLEEHLNEKDSELREAQTLDEEDHHREDI
jgi:hypothetical protein